MKRILMMLLLVSAVLACEAQTTRTRAFNTSKCDRCETGTFFWKLFHCGYCAWCAAEPEPEPLPMGCVNMNPTDPDNANCRYQGNDAYLHPEYFMDADGNCYCEGCMVIWDHPIDWKFWNTIRQEVYAQTGVWMDSTQAIDMKLTLLETGDTLVRYDIFHNCTADGRPTWFNTNEVSWQEWSGYIHDKLSASGTYTFGIELTYRPTGLHVNEYWMDQKTGLPHYTVTLKYTGFTYP